MFQDHQGGGHAEIGPGGRILEKGRLAERGVFVIARQILHADSAGLMVSA